MLSRRCRLGVVMVNLRSMALHSTHLGKGLSFRFEAIPLIIRDVSSVPVLLQILSGVTNANDLLPSGSVYNLPFNKTIEINIPGGGNVRLPHPVPQCDPA